MCLEAPTDSSPTFLSLFKHNVAKVICYRILIVEELQPITFKDVAEDYLAMPGKAEIKCRLDLGYFSTWCRNKSCTNSQK